MKDDFSLDANIEKFLEIVLRIHETCIPLIKVKQRVEETHWLNEKIVKMIEHKNFCLENQKNQKA